MKTNYVIIDRSHQVALFMNNASTKRTKIDQATSPNILEAPQSDHALVSKSPKKNVGENFFKKGRNELDPRVNLRKLLWVSKL